MSDFWTNVGVDADNEQRDRAVTAATIACAPHFGFVASATTTIEFDDRVSLVSEHVEAKVLAAVGNEPGMFPGVHQAVLDGWREDWQKLQDQRARESQMRNNRRAALRRRAAMNFYPHSDDIVGYTYRADNYTPKGVIEALIQRGEASPAARDMAVEEVLDQIAGSNGIDREDERSFDSDEFPKVIFLDQMSDGEELMDERGEYHTASLRRRAAKPAEYDKADKESRVICPHSECDFHGTHAEVGKHLSEKHGSRKTAEALDEMEQAKRFISDRWDGLYRIQRGSPTLDGAPTWEGILHGPDGDVVTIAVNPDGSFFDMTRGGENDNGRGVEDRFRLIQGEGSRKLAYSDTCPYCGKVGCSPDCPGPSGGSTTCPKCGSAASIHDGVTKCSDPEGCGYGWDPSEIPARGYREARKMGFALAQHDASWGIENRYLLGTAEATLDEQQISFIAGYHEGYNAGMSGSFEDGLISQGALIAEAEFPPKKEDDEDDEEEEEKPEGEEKPPPPAAEGQPPAPGAPAVPEGSDPAMMEVGEKSRLNFTMVDDASAGDVEVVFVREENGVYFFNGPTGEFGVANTTGEWKDSAGNTFDFAPLDGSAPEDDPKMPKADPGAEDTAADNAGTEEGDSKDGPPWAKKSGSRHPFGKSAAKRWTLDQVKQYARISWTRNGESSRYSEWQRTQDPPTEWLRGYILGAKHAQDGSGGTFSGPATNIYDEGYIAGYDDAINGFSRLSSRKTAGERDPGSEPGVHTFEDTGSCYDETQTNDDIKFGDVLVIPSEKVVGFLLAAWPVAVTKEPGHLHGLNDPSRPPQGEPGDTPEEIAAWAAGWNKAREIARQRGWELAAP